MQVKLLEKIVGVVVVPILLWGAFACAGINADQDFKTIFLIPRPKTQTEARAISGSLITTIMALSHEADIRWNRSAKLDLERDYAEGDLARAREFGSFFPAKEYERLKARFAAAKDGAEKARRLTEGAQALVLDACAAADGVEHFTAATRPKPCPAAKGNYFFPFD
jgi:hypothetical protein